MTELYRAQHGEDRWLERHFRNASDGVFVEVGAHDGLTFSNTYRLETLGWRGVLVEPDPDRAAACRVNRPQAHVFECACLGPSAPPEITFHKVVEFDAMSTATMTDFHESRLRESGYSTRTTTVRARTLDTLLEEAGLLHVDFVSIDVEEGELEVLRGFDICRWKPRVVMIESNGAERKPEIREYFNARGYTFLRTIVINDIYVPVIGLGLMTRTIDAGAYLAKQWWPQIRSQPVVRGAVELARRVGIVRLLKQTMEPPRTPND